MARKYVAVFIAVLVGVVLLGPISASVQGNTGTVSVTDETAYADVGNFTDLDGYEIESGTVTVEYRDSNGTFVTATDGTDYELATTNGSVRALSSGSIPDNAELRVDYDYQATDATTSTVAGLIPLFVGLMAIVALATRMRRMMP
jgi:cobyric acid synthase